MSEAKTYTVATYDEARKLLFGDPDVFTPEQHADRDLERIQQFLVEWSAAKHQICGRHAPDYFKKRELFADINDKIDELRDLLYAERGKFG